MSAEKLNYTIMLTVHRIALVALVIVAAFGVYLFGFKS